MKTNPAKVAGSDIGLSVYEQREGKYSEVTVTILDLVALEAYSLSHGFYHWDYDEYDGEYGWIIGTIIATRESRVDTGPSEDSLMEVGASVARSGWGPLLYDATMFAVDDRLEGGRGWTFPDRGTVSEQARKVWLYYRTKRPDVDHRELPEMLRVRNEPPYINLAYSPNALFDRQPFLQMEGNLKTLLAKHGADPEELDRQAAKRGSMLFRDVYREIRGGRYPGQG